MFDPSAPRKLTAFECTDLLSNFHSTSLLTRCHALKGLHCIALTLGRTRVAQELLPYLLDFTDDEEEVVALLSSALQHLVQDDRVADANKAYQFLPLLQQLLASEEAAIRDQSAQTMQFVIRRLSDCGVILTHIQPLIQQLVTADWFTSRIAATPVMLHTFVALLPFAQQQHNNNNSESLQQQQQRANAALAVLQQQFVQLLQDETPMVRRSGVATLAKLVEYLPTTTVDSVFMPLCESLVSDEPDTVRLQLVSVLHALCSHTYAQSRDACMTHVWPLMNALSSDASWRVRWRLADAFADISAAILHQNTDTESPITAATQPSKPADPLQAPLSGEMCTCYLKLLSDEEHEVRHVTTHHLPLIVKLCLSPSSQLIASEIIPALTPLSVDESPAVRAELSSVLMRASCFMEPSLVIGKVLPVYLALLKDSDSDVRLALISHVNTVTHLLDREIMSHSLLPAILDLSKDAQYRVRAQLCRYMPLLAQRLETELFTSKVFPICLSWLSDKVSAVRNEAADCIKLCTQRLGAEWANTAVLPSLISLCEHKVCQQRLTAIASIQRLQPCIPTLVFAQRLAPLLVQLTRDTVPNVRISSLRCCTQCCKDQQSNQGAPAISPSLRQTLIAAINACTQDDDVDVAYTAQQAILQIQSNKQ